MPDNAPLLHETQAILDAEHRRVVRIEPLLRRLSRALADLGSPAPNDWASSDDGETFNFSSLTGRQFDRLVCLVEDLAANRPVQVTIVRGGPTLFDPGAPSGPSPTPVPSSVHIVVAS